MRQAKAVTNARCFVPGNRPPHRLPYFRFTLERVSLLEVTQILKDTAISLSKANSSGEIYNLAVQNIRQALQVDRAIFYIIDEDFSGSIIAESVVAGWPCCLGTQVDDPCLVDYVEKHWQAGVIAINDIYQANLSDCYIQQLERFAVRANLVAPILLGDKLLGLLIAHQCSQPRFWQQSEISLFEQFVRIVSLSLERANLLEQAQKGRTIAETVSQQQRLQKEQLELQLLQLIDQVREASQGNLTVRAEVSSGEIGTIAEFLNYILENLQEIIIQVKQAASQVDVAIASNFEAMDQLAVASLKQTEVQGFVAIAQEVGMLAAHSSAATAEIEEIVANIQLETSQVVKAMELGTTQVMEGTRLVQNTKQNLNHILDVCRQIDQLVNAISAATISQVQTSTEVSALMEEIAKISQITSNSSRQASTLLQQTMEISQQLQARVRTFKVS